MSNDVIIRVRVRQDARDGFAAVGREAEAEGEKAGQKFTTRFGGVMGRMAQLIQEPLRRAGQQIGDHLGEHSGKNMVTRLGNYVSSSAAKLVEIGRNLGQAIGGSLSREVSDSIVRGARGGDARTRGGSGAGGGRGGDSTSSSRSTGASGGHGRSGGDGGRGGDASVDVDKQSLLSRFAEWGKDAANSFWGSFSGAIATFFSGDFLTLLLKAGIGAALAALIAPAIGAAVVAGVELALGGGIIGLGVAAAFKDPRIQASATELKTRLGKLFEDFGKPFRSPVANFLERIARDILPQLEKYGPVLAQIFAPLAGKLGDGLIGFIQNLLPGLVDGIKNAAPIIEVLAKRLPDIGQALGDFFREMGEHGDEGAQFFNDLIDVMLKVIDVVGKMIGVFASFYSVSSRIVRNAIRLVRDLYESWERGLRIVVTAVLEFALNVIAWFGRILNAAVASMGWIPGIGAKLRGAQAQFRGFREGVNAELGKIKDKTVTIRMRTFGLAAANAAVSVAEQLAALGYGKASGGLIGAGAQIGRAASGGIRNGLTLVGERGPELIDAAPGSRVHSNEDTRRMMSAGSGDDYVALARFEGSSDPLVNEIMKRIQVRVVRRFGGSVQAAMGRGAA